MFLELLKDGHQHPHSGTQPAQGAPFEAKQIWRRRELSLLGSRTLSAQTQLDWEDARGMGAPNRSS